MENGKDLIIGKVAAQAGVNVQTIRYYERQGLLPKAARTESGYRTYRPDAIDRVRFIKRAQAMGFSLVEIEELLALRVGPEATCGDVRRLAESKITLIEEKIASLRAMKQALSELAHACSGRGPASECSLLEAIQSQEKPKTSLKRRTEP